MTGTDALLRELNHRVKNNFQIIASLMNLKKRMLPPERQEDIRFLQEHVQAMAVAYRLAYASADMVDVSVGEMVRQVISELRQIARLDARHLSVTDNGMHGTMGLDQAIALGLYLAVILPPFLDYAQLLGARVAVFAEVQDARLTLSISGGWTEPLEMDALRRQLSAAYFGQLQAEALPTSARSELSLRLLLAGYHPGPIVPTDETD